MRVDDFDFVLPDDRIALYPADARDASRLLVLPTAGPPVDGVFRDIAAQFCAGDVLVLNDTRVFPAALRGFRPARAHGGGDRVPVEVNLLEVAQSDTDRTVWRSFARPAKRLVPGDAVHFTGGVTGTVVGRNGAETDIAFGGDSATVFAAITRIGQPPLPPYIARKREMDPSDTERYQTVYADQTKAGSVAAPTAGLHFTKTLLSDLEDKGVRIVRVTLHVGPGTFLPVTATKISEHKMHAEWGEVSTKTANDLQAMMDGGARVTAVGTTALRLLETAATGRRQVTPFAGDTDIFITPGYTFKVVDRLITNFHLPRSTLLMLVAAFSGRERILQAYDHAIREGYRFYSYGDACLLERVS